MTVDPHETTQAASAERQQRAAALAATDEPSPPRPPLTPSEGIKLIGGLVVVCTGLLVLVAIAVTAMILVEAGSDVVAVATSAFGVIGTVVGAYFGVKIGTDGTQTAVAGLRDEAAKAQAFAAHIPREEAQTAIAQAQELASAGAEAATSRPSTAGPR
jgi:hypothetical protein